mmetsp:Transcript_21652/g.39748  ORF Transcript_21652/g.39748 Transcript_21652/m.39748 type:complete len:111 (-) Transcript_21652:613-945(-)
MLVLGIVMYAGYNSMIDWMPVYGCCCRVAIKSLYLEHRDDNDQYHPLLSACAHVEKVEHISSVLLDQYMIPPLQLGSMTIRETILRRFLCHVLPRRKLVRCVSTMIVTAT